MFNLQNENIDVNFRDTIQKQVTFVSSTVTVAAAATAVVSTAGTITSIVLSNAGSGYDTAPEVSIADATTRATVTSSIGAGGTILDLLLQILEQNILQTNPPIVLIAPPMQERQKLIQFLLMREILELLLVLEQPQLVLELLK